MMSHSTPFQSFLGGLSIPIPVHALLLLNGSVLGVSGFVHRAMKGNPEALSGAVGLILGGVFVAMLENTSLPPPLLPLPKVLLSGFLVGFGTKLSNGCTSGHMISGLSRFSLRSLVATATFFITGVVTTYVFHQDLPAISTTDWSLGPIGSKLLAFQAVPLALSVLLYNLSPADTQLNPSVDEHSTLVNRSDSSNSLLRLLAPLITGCHFALALRLSNLTDPTRVLSFLLLPFHRAFDPSLAFLAVGALPLNILLYHYAHGNERPCLGGKWGIPNTPGKIDVKLVVGAAIFGVGWGLTGVCPGPGLVNFGRSLVGNSNPTPFAGWLGGVALGGLLAW